MNNGYSDKVELNETKQKAHQLEPGEPIENSKEEFLVKPPALNLPKGGGATGKLLQNTESLSDMQNRIDFLKKQKELMEAEIAFEKLKKESGTE